MKKEKKDKQDKQDVYRQTRQGSGRKKRKEIAGGQNGFVLLVSFFLSKRLSDRIVASLRRA